MSEQQLEKERHTAIHLLRSGLTVKEVAQATNRSIKWVYKWRDRYESESWGGLVSQSRARHQNSPIYGEDIHALILQVRSELEAEAASDQGLCYVGAPTIRARLMQRIGNVDRVPSTATIERVLVRLG